jgi:hypothetical protein
VSEQLVPAANDGVHVVLYGKSAVSVSASPIVSSVVVESVTEAVAVSPILVCGNASVVALKERRGDGADGVLLQLADKSVESKGIVRSTRRALEVTTAGGQRAEGVPHERFEEHAFGASRRAPRRTIAFQSVRID